MQAPVDGVATIATAVCSAHLPTTLDGRRLDGFRARSRPPSRLSSKRAGRVTPGEAPEKARAQAPGKARVRTRVRRPRAPPPVRARSPAAASPGLFDRRGASLAAAWMVEERGGDGFRRGASGVVYGGRQPGARLGL